MQDLQGPKIRVGSLVGGGPVQLEPGRELVITPPRRSSAPPSGSAARTRTWPSDVQPGDRILLDDGRIRLTVLGATDGEVRTRVEEGGPLGEHKGINLPGRGGLVARDHRQGPRRPGASACTSLRSTTWRCRSCAPPTKCARRRT